MAVVNTAPRYRGSTAMVRGRDTASILFYQGRQSMMYERLRRPTRGGHAAGGRHSACDRRIGPKGIGNSGGGAGASGCLVGPAGGFNSPEPATLVLAAAG